MNNNPLSKINLSNPWHLLATGFGSGLSPVVPGTAGTLASIPFYLLLVHFPAWLYILILVFASIIGVKICSQTSSDMGVHDHGSIVWDEFVGFWITMLVVPLLNLPVFDWHWIAIGFIYFRIYDMLKPWPISWLDKNVHGGVGIMIDDIVAGIAAGLTLWFTHLYF
ncbi:phosphatidylglycerophosphatase A [Vibrio salinus]|uniref:phosphatidylglycerophosphatase A n=1 Tax=Vibrio salinus TaxID=2899784 RepID=UPI001E5147C8|nr:phosphatidylglycerophosphatase A [Vibrio salinus]MCE0494378.1 phosphatidylglycerophosphatase A [Vibrio salinus]